VYVHLCDGGSGRTQFHVPAFFYSEACALDGAAAAANPEPASTSASSAASLSDDEDDDDDDSSVMSKLRLPAAV
jgi:hypothetical protein